MAPSADQHGEESEVAAPQSVQDTQTNREKRSENERKVGESDSKRSLGEPEVGDDLVKLIPYLNSLFFILKMQLHTANIGSVCPYPVAQSFPLGLYHELWE